MCVARHPVSGAFYAMWLHWIAVTCFYLDISTVRQPEQSQSRPGMRRPSGVPASYRAVADHGNVPHSTLHHRARGQTLMAEKA